MIVVRPIEKRDEEAFVNIAFETGIGITSLPKNRPALLQQLASSIESFSKLVKKPGDENYIFVLEDLSTGILGGTSGIIAHGGFTPLNFFRLETIPSKESGQLKTLEIPIMRLIHYLDAPTEICSLYLSPRFRQGGLGRLLSLARFLFMAAHPERFEKVLFAEMRGYIEEDLFCPFWEGIGRHFIDIEFSTLMQLRDKEILDISQLFPSYPIYIGMLPDKLRNTIGIVHANTRPALNILIQEGFYHTEEIDVFDGGPKIEAETSDVRTIKESFEEIVAEISLKPSKTPPFILSNNRIDFRACYASIESKGTKGVIIPAEAAEALQLQVGDAVRYSTPAWEKREREGS